MTGDEIRSSNHNLKVSTIDRLSTCQMELEVVAFSVVVDDFTPCSWSPIHLSVCLSIFPLSPSACLCSRPIWHVGWSGRSLGCGTASTDHISSPLDRQLQLQQLLLLVQCALITHHPACRARYGRPCRRIFNACHSAFVKSCVATSLAGSHIEIHFSASHRQSIVDTTSSAQRWNCLQAAVAQILRRAYFAILDSDVAKKRLMWSWLLISVVALFEPVFEFCMKVK